MPKVKTFKDYFTKSFDEQVNNWLDDNAGKILIHQFLYGGAGGDSAYFCLTIVYDEVVGDMFGENIKKKK